MAVEVFQGDCREVISYLDIGKFDFIFADPPFNIGQLYVGYDDKRNEDEFSLMLHGSIDECWRACRGVLALHGPDDLVEHYLSAASEFGMKRIAWINWHYRFGQCGRSNWINTRCHCLVFAREGYTWNPEDVLVDSDRASKYNDPRIADTANGGRRLPGTVWGIPSDGPYWGRVQGNSQERVPNRPNQLPEVYLERLIRAYTNPGDRVLDPFGGTGTTAVVADALGRDCVTIDVSKDACEAIRARVARGAVRIPKLEFITE